MESSLGDTGNYEYLIGVDDIVTNCKGVIFYHKQTKISLKLTGETMLWLVIISFLGQFSLC